MTTLLEELQRINRETFFPLFADVVAGRCNVSQARVDLTAVGGLRIGAFVALYMTDEVWEKIVKPALDRAPHTNKGDKKIILP